ncbi:helix-turn-helix transcriptional regulator [Streptosporangium sp. 'caverna']|uniref:helix-turn-helix domain-containing protein n=1 Tax=Streptosporangium sp. 'caverna' TaxID=2202249 RepID=UPI000D7E8B87|nr:helix-turn-helix transcriptional regulator [Streptosporangium sp. 'caverna']AWS41604.1 transcriptional regulator [Streptosporangium sp. 'caverna']
MNVSHANEQEIDPVVWERPQMRQALAARDMAAVYGLLQRIGISQRHIAALTAQSQSEISEILKGRQVMAYEVLGRIADGLGIPRGYMGLAYDASSARLVGTAVSNHYGDSDEDEQVRRMLAHAAQVTIGVATGDSEEWAEPLAPVETPAPHRIGMADVEQVETVTRTLRALDYKHGGGVCRDAVVAQLAWSQRLLHATCTEKVALRLHEALADQHNLAGWTSFDVGLYGPARGHLARALEQAKHARNSSLAANVLYRMGRVHLHCDRVMDALRFFQLGQICAQDASCERTVAMLCANEAWAYALLGDSELALKSISRARDELARASARDREPPVWVSFFGAADLDATNGMVYAGLTDAHLETAEQLLTSAIESRDPSMTRSRAFELTALATVQLRAGDLSTGITTGREAVALAAQIRSARIIDRLAPLEDAATRRTHNCDAQGLARSISEVRAA